MTKIFVFEYLTGGGIDPALAGAASLADLSALIVEGRVMRDALAADLRRLDGVQVSIASSRFESVDPALVHCMAAPGESMTAFVARAARQHDYAWIIAPECDGLLLHLYDAVGATRWLGCAKEAIRLASSKSATAACLAAHGIATTPAIEPGQAAARAGSKWVVKPDDGAGGLDTFVFDDFAQACAEYDARAAAARNPVLQEWVDGEPLSLSLICDGARTELVSINRQRIGLFESTAPGQRASIVEFDGVTVNQIDTGSDQGKTLRALAERVARAIPGLRGFAGIDVVWHPSRGPVVIEVNPRLTVAYAGLTAALGRNLSAALLAAHGVRIHPLERGETGAQDEPDSASARSFDAHSACGAQP
ncbi:ATP-grasp domain-containing protein [bacterium M00.F.Ca.ET.228.01.1.1]|uniref:ATP-grasp domain-containing protein n=1 Tax=Paraburkholderia phenoliruptrix TaxID=252970 RepID=UPI001091AADD|nr:ATP-grasp domain-containing protein [Paraburkholderia phenoliruptrix]TGP47915.1 ATP-grasp domain-containing protein [bacterium M00.F.Ca.ET.228.01.1.1]TGS05707.1 ATP-grasp domain-containing protein [bacterium M00.F.Ca.ET.191.01.1.1]TGU10644.1 ATP-grasp domain-containing protein [bacterium M00.F.Ca.ET.155.01.1.1]MBW0445277.1 ATP-grasp domain-containing protein [Paraburkholderia phenoliruptrix]MBW9096042.1 ATP-grasp domain-containing protein [Paraburkholderia phenoliruptrix]